MINLIKKSRTLAGITAGLALVLTSVATFTIAPAASATTYFDSVHCEINQEAYAFLNRTDNYAFLPGNFCIQSQNARTIFQTDGNLVTYLNGRAVWASHTENRGASFLSLQGDGNVVIYNRNNTALWNTRTNGKVGTGGNVLAQLSNGQLNVYTVTYGTGAWTQVW